MIIIEPAFVEIVMAEKFGLASVVVSMTGMVEVIMCSRAGVLVTVTITVNGSLEVLVLASV